MTKSIVAAALLTALGAGRALAQENATCEPGTAALSELVVWRGGARSVSDVATVRTTAACQTPGTAPAAIVVSDRGLIRGEALSIPDLTEIEALVLDSPAVGAGAAPTDSDVPEVFERAAVIRAERHGMRAVIHDPARGDSADSMIHMIVREASPDRLEVDVQPIEGPAITLRWTRSLEEPSWVPVAETATS
jgi:hypothetical protein